MSEARVDPVDGEPRADLDEPPPLLGSWRRIYALVFVSQVLLATLFYVITRIYAP